MIHLFLVAFFYALAVPGVVTALRALPPIEKLALDGVKPWACDICSCFWTTAVLTVLAAMVSFPDGFDAVAQAVAAAAPGYTGALLVLRWVQQPVGAGPGLPEE